MAYMIEGSGSKTWSNAKMWLYQNELASTQLLQMLTDIIIDYLVEQVHAGAQVMNNITLIFEVTFVILEVKLVSV